MPPCLRLLPQSEFNRQQWRTLRGYFANRELAQWNGASPLWLPLFLFRPMMREKPAHTRSFGILCGEEMVGTAELYDLRPQHLPQAATLGIMLGQQHWGQGYGRQAVGLLLHHAFAEEAGGFSPPLDKVTLSTFGHNLRAQKAFAAAGFREISRSHSRGRENVHMVITRQEYLQHASGG